jgi:hypothetical protein
MGRGIVRKPASERWLASTVGPVRSGPPFRFPERRHGGAELRYAGGIPLLTAQGTPEEIGEAVGVLALRPGRRMADYPDDLLRAFWLRPLRRPILQAGRWLARRFPDDYRREMEAMYAAAGLDHDRAVLGNTFYDVKKVAFCSALLVTAQRSTEGGPGLGRNLDYPPLGYANEYSLVTVYRPRRVGGTEARHGAGRAAFLPFPACPRPGGADDLWVRGLDLERHGFGSHRLSADLQRGREGSPVHDPGCRYLWTGERGGSGRRGQSQHQGSAGPLAPPRTWSSGSSKTTTSLPGSTRTGLTSRSPFILL